MTLLSEAECRDLASRVLDFSRADGVEVVVSDSERTHLRFARNTPSGGGIVRRTTIAVESSFGSRSASAQGNQLDSRSLEELVRRSEELARRAPEDPEFVALLGPQEYAAAPAASLQEPGALAHLMRGVERCLEEARSAGLVAAGYVECETSVRALANSAGLSAYHVGTVAHLSETARTSDGRGSGWASCAAEGAAGLDFEGVSQRACAKARASAAPRPLLPGSYPAVLEPACVASLLQLLVSAMDAREADEGRSFFAREGGGTRLGEALFPDWVDLRSDPAHALVPTVPWGEDGLAHRATDWIREGRVAALHASRFWAGKQGRDPLPAPPNLLFDEGPGGAGGGTGTAEELVRSLDGGILVTNLWYIRSVDPRTLLYTGLTRDGVFWVERGEIVYPVNNFRWNDSPARVLARTRARSTPVRVGGRGGESRNVYVPGLLVEEFELSSVSDAV